MTTLYYQSRTAEVYQSGSFRNFLQGKTAWYPTFSNTCAPDVETRTDSILFRASWQNNYSTSALPLPSKHL